MSLCVALTRSSWLPNPHRRHLHSRTPTPPPPPSHPHHRTITPTPSAHVPNLSLTCLPCTAARMFLGAALGTALRTMFDHFTKSDDDWSDVMPLAHCYEKLAVHERCCTRALYLFNQRGHHRRGTMLSTSSYCQIRYFQRNHRPLFCIMVCTCSKAKSKACE